MEYNRLNELQVSGRQEKIYQDCKTCKTAQPESGQNSDMPGRTARLRAGMLLVLLVVVFLMAAVAFQVSDAQAQNPAPAAAAGFSIHVVN